MAFHHLAIATRDIDATHRFYSEAMGFELVKVEVGPAGERGFAKHLFYDTGNGEMIAFWDLHDPDLAPDWSPAIATGLGLPVWSNHIAFAAVDMADIDRRRDHWLASGVDVMEVDHDWCFSIYARDPNGIMVEWCTSTRPMTQADRSEALELLGQEKPSFEPNPKPKFYKAADYRKGA